MAPPRSPKKKPSGKKSTARKPAAKKAKAADGGFPAALADLLRSREIEVPDGLLDAPADAYASQPASFVEQLERLPDAEIVRFAEKVAGYARRQAERAEAEWERSPLIGELRRRGLKEPARPLKPSGVSVSLAKPLADWSDSELLKAAQAWSKLGRS
jgi:hypothetical protein